ncbi:MAG: HAD family hydrolase [Candidatus Spechtbacterales bacterium]|nr:HAD family hydrolase [Candidatus Spechtbacterales bacterium]
MADKKRNNKVIFLDRDGVINKKPPAGEYIIDVSNFELLPHSAKAIKRLKENGYSVYVITSQSAIGQGLMSEDDLRDIHKELQKYLAVHDAEIDAFYHCPHNKDEGCDCRKPKPGLIFRAAEENNIDLGSAIYIGDEERDMEAAKAAGCRALLATDDNHLLRIVDDIL